MLWEDDSSRRTPPLIYRKKHTAGLNIIVAPFSTFSFFCTTFRLEMIFTKMSEAERTSIARAHLQRFIDVLDPVSDRFGTLSGTFVFRRSGTCKILRKMMTIFGSKRSTFFTFLVRFKNTLNILNKNNFILFIFTICNNEMWQNIWVNELPLTDIFWMKN